MAFDFSCDRIIVKMPVFGPLFCSLQDIVCLTDEYVHCVIIMLLGCYKICQSPWQYSEVFQACVPSNILSICVWNIAAIQTSSS